MPIQVKRLVYLVSAAATVILVVVAANLHGQQVKVCFGLAAATAVIAFVTRPPALTL